jgi:hypothetical protein
MSEFTKYMHVERFGNTEVDGIEFGTTHIFPKLDGTNASVWFNDDGPGAFLGCGSRNRRLSLANDNAGFMNWAILQDNIKDYLYDNSNHILYGEWLVPHTLKTYREDCWRRFYVFDVWNGERYLPYDMYKPQMEAFGIEYIPCTTIGNNISFDQLLTCAQKNTLYVQEGQGIGEGIVIKNYDYYNKLGNQVWAKIVTDDFKVQHYQAMGANEIGGKMLEEEIAEKFVTSHLVDKVVAKITLENDGWTSKYIPQLLGVVFYDLVKEDMWEIIKLHKNPKIDFKVLNRFVINKIKTLRLDLF